MLAGESREHVQGYTHLPLLIHLREEFIHVCQVLVLEKEPLLSEGTAPCQQAAGREQAHTFVAALSTYCPQKGPIPQRGQGSGHRFRARFFVSQPLVPTPPGRTAWQK